MRLAITIVTLYFLISSANGIDVNLKLEHSLDGMTFTTAGSLQGSILETDFSRGEQLTLLRNDLTAQEQDLLANLVQQNLLYKLRIASDPAREDSPKISTSIPARCLASTGLQDHFQLHATPSGKLIGINYDFARHPCIPAEAAVRIPDNLNFPESSQVAVWMPVAAPVLRKTEATFVEGSRGKVGKPLSRNSKTAAGSRVAGDKSEAPAEDNRPWIVKNWMIALPLAFVAMNVMGTLMGPQEAVAPAAAAPSANARRR